MQIFASKREETEDNSGTNEQVSVSVLLYALVRIISLSFQFIEANQPGCRKQRLAKTPAS